MPALKRTDDGPAACNEGARGGIQMAWVDWAGRDR